MSYSEDVRKRVLEYMQEGHTQAETQEVFKVGRRDVLNMEKTTSQIIKEYVKEQKFGSTAEIMQAIKEMFQEVLQQVLESELEEKLGYGKSERMSESNEKEESKNYRNGYSKKTVKTQLGEIEVKIPRDRKGEYEPQIKSTAKNSKQKRSD